MARTLAAVLSAFLLAACGQAPEPTDTDATAEAPEAAPAAGGPDTAALRQQATALFDVLPDEASSEVNPVTDAKITLGRTLYYETRLSRNHDVSCNSCHRLDAFGVDGEPTSEGHRGQRGVRNSPTVYNAALHLAQFWDGRAADVEEQAKGPVLNPVEMAMPSGESVLVVLRSIPGYAPLFQAAFPEDADPISYDNMARAIGAFERRLLTPGRWDAYLEGADAALSDAELAGLETFVSVGCIQCHVGPALGGTSYQKLGRNKPYPTSDPGRFEVTGQEADRHFFKVPSLRNVEKTGPYFHDGSVTSLDEAIRRMGEYQLGRSLSPQEVTSIQTFLASLTGEVDQSYVQPPDLPESGPETPAPDPS